MKFTFHSNHRTGIHRNFSMRGWPEYRLFISFLKFLYIPTMAMSSQCHQNEHAEHHLSELPKNGVFFGGQFPCQNDAKWSLIQKSKNWSQFEARCTSTNCQKCHGEGWEDLGSLVDFLVICHDIHLTLKAKGIPLKTTLGPSGFSWISLSVFFCDESTKP